MGANTSTSALGIHALAIVLSRMRRAPPPSPVVRRATTAVAVGAALSTASRMAAMVAGSTRTIRSPSAFVLYDWRDDDEPPCLGLGVVLPPEPRFGFSAFSPNDSRAAASAAAALLRCDTISASEVVSVVRDASAASVPWWATIL